MAQTSRGCPFECNFCDVIQYLGRKQRHKTNEQVIAEVQRLYDLGYNRIALADDNLTVYRKRATSLLEALAAWNGTDGRDYVNFATQVSIDVARDENILRLCAEAGVSDLFVGIESVNEESLKGANKRQNLHTDMVAQVRRIVSYGLRVEATLMVGFDADSKRIFEQQYDFGMSLPVGPFYVSALMAPKATPFYDDMLAAGRIAADDVQRHSPGTGFITNILPAQMTREELSIGTRWLISRLFHPDAFWIRFQHVAEYLGRNPLRDRGTGKLYNAPERALTGRLVGRMIRQLARQDERVAAVLRKASVLMRNRPDIGDGLGEVLSSWIVALHTHREKGAYDPGLALLDRPPLAPPGSAERVPTFSRALDTAA